MKSDLSEWSSFSDPGSHITWQSGAGLAGTSGGMQVDINGAVRYARKTLASPSTTGIVRVRFYFDPNTTLQGTSDLFVIAKVWNSTPVFLFMLGFGVHDTDDGHWDYQFGVNTDVGEVYPNGFTLSDATPHMFEIMLTRATNSTSSDGSLQWWI